MNNNNPFIQTSSTTDQPSTSFETALLLPDLFEHHIINSLSFNPNPFNNKTNNNDQLINPSSCSEHYLHHPSSHFGFQIPPTPQLPPAVDRPSDIHLAPLQFDNGLTINNLDPLLLNPNNNNNNNLSNSIDCWIDFTGGDSSCSPSSSSGSTTTSPTGSALTDPPASTASNHTVPPSLIVDHHPVAVQQQQQSYWISPEQAPQPLLPPPPPPPPPPHAPPAAINSQVIPGRRTSYKRQCTRKTEQSLSLIEPSARSSSSASSSSPPPSDSSCSPSPSTSSSCQEPLSKSKPKNKKKNTNIKRKKKKSSSSQQPKPSTSAAKDGPTSSSNDHHTNNGTAARKKMMVKKKGEGRNEFLERNRLAASRSRAKKKTYQQFLEDQAGRLEAEQARLHAIIHNLILEKDHLKSLVQAHSLATSHIHLQLP
ncbi:hypothetical protein PGT21_003908 [Puccinia graminis f. sp. tritici]|uniref:BZIP domain-containing protein n=1 Tax=Puccinia graminis f. sp. tritici TaxID=56615 RepID=A0A5B0SIE4_PUCGR|nr:hypothetical protein PGT21_003908 [Puccinia graminis f. sp. tritici]KAA1137239.1 hypothetical protein PGTUg99_009488 [Puccinia graminis f. sp. tritici]